MNSSPTPHPPPDERSVRVTVAIVTYQSKAELSGCLDSLLASDMRAKVVIIDNGSTDGTLQIAETYERRHADVVVVRSGANIGLAAGNNLVKPHLVGDYVMMLNPDTLVAADTLSKLVKMLDEDPRVGVVGPKCLYDDGRPHTNYHRGWGLGHLFVWRVVPYSIVRYLYDRLATYRERQVRFVSGACLLMRSDLFRRVDGYDPNYFLTVEDVCDLCDRVRDLGYKILFTPRTSIVHFCGRSGASVPYLSTLEGYKGDIYHFSKHHSWLVARCAYVIVVFACAIKSVVSVVKMALFRRHIDRKNWEVYREILPKLIRAGLGIAYSSEGRGS